VKVLWAFESKEKLDFFIELLIKHEIPYEVLSKDEKDPSIKGIQLAIEDENYVKAKRLLLKHRKRRTSSDQN